MTSRIKSNSNLKSKNHSQLEQKNYPSYKEINLYSLSFDDPTFDSITDTFVSKVSYIKKSKSKSKSKVKFQSGELFFLGTSTSTSNNNTEIEAEFSNNTSDFYDTMCSLDNCVTDWVFKNGKEWLGSNLNADTVDSLYKKTVLLPTDLKSNPRIILEIDQKNDLLKTVKKLDYNSCFSGVLCIEGLRFHKNKFVLMLKVKSIEKIIQAVPDDSVNGIISDSYNSSSADTDT